MAAAVRRARSLGGEDILGTKVITGELQHQAQALPEASAAPESTLVQVLSPPAAFSPVFDLELGSCNATPQQSRVPTRQNLYPDGGGGDGLGPGEQQRAPAARQPPRQPAVPAGALDRSQSDLQVMLLHHSASTGKPYGHGMAPPEQLTPTGQRLLELLRPSTELEMELARHLRAFRNARLATSHNAKGAAAGDPATMRSPRRPAGGIAAAAASANPYPGYAPTGPTAPPHPAALYPAAASAAVGSGAGVAAAADGIVLAAGPTAGAPMPGEIEALASQLMAAGFLVQIRDGTRHSKDARSCLRTLKHRFLVCLGWQPTGAAGSGTLAPTQLLEPLVVEPRFREQFLIANPSRDYGLLLLALPVVFVGPLRRLDAAVALIAEEVAAAFRAAGRSLPPWRTKGAMLSKWAPDQLQELERLLQHAHDVAGEPMQGQAVQAGEAVWLQEAAPVAFAAPGAPRPIHFASAFLPGPSALGVPVPVAGPVSAEGLCMGGSAGDSPDAGAAVRDLHAELEVVARSNSEPQLARGQSSSCSGNGWHAAAAAALATMRLEGGRSSGGSGEAEMEGVAVLGEEEGEEEGDTGGEDECEVDLARAQGGDEDVRDSGGLGAAGSNNGARAVWRDGGGASAEAASAACGPPRMVADTLQPAGLEAVEHQEHAPSGAFGLTFPLLPQPQPQPPLPPLPTPHGGILQPGPTLQPLLQPQPAAPSAASRAAFCSPFMQQPQQRDHHQQQQQDDPNIVPAGHRTAFSPFATVSMPEEREIAAARSSHIIGSPGSCLTDAHALPEFTLMHTAMLGAGGSPAHRFHSNQHAFQETAFPDPRRAAMPVNTPSARPQLVDDDAHTDTPHDSLEDEVPPLPRHTHTQHRVRRGNAPTALEGYLSPQALTHQPLAAGALVPAAAAARGGGAIARAAGGAGGEADGDETVRGGRNQGQGHGQGTGRVSALHGLFGGPNAVAPTHSALQQHHQQMLRITRRSSSDLSRAAAKFKGAKSMLAAALKLASGGSVSASGALPSLSPAGSSGSSGSTPGGTVSAPGVKSPGAACRGWQVEGPQTPLPQQQQQQQQGREGGCAAPAAAAAAAGQRGGSVVAVPGGVVVKTSPAEPAWARITTVRWGQPPAAAAGR